MDKMVTANPKAAPMNAKEIVDARFVKELEDIGFIVSVLQKNKRLGIQIRNSL